LFSGEKLLGVSASGSSVFDSGTTLATNSFNMAYQSIRHVVDPHICRIDHGQVQRICLPA
jgi:hypothetical protein